MDYISLVTKSPRTPKSPFDRMNPMRLSPIRSPMKTKIESSPSHSRIVSQSDQGSRAECQLPSTPKKRPMCSPPSPLLVSQDRRGIPSRPYQSIYIPCLKSDFQLSPLDWSQKNLVAIAQMSQITLICPLPLESFLLPIQNLTASSLKFVADGSSLAVGSDSGEVRIVDLVRNVISSVSKLQESEVYSIDSCKSMLSAALESGKAFLFDNRREDPVIAELNASSGECLTVKFSSNEAKLLTSGAENEIKIWDIRKTESPLIAYRGHASTCRAACWCPNNSSLVATGGGQFDKSIRIWNVDTGNTLGSVTTENQICNLFWNGSYNELLVTHGYDNNLISIWSATDMKIVSSFKAHHSRVLYAAMSPDSSRCVTSSPSDPMYFWNFFPDYSKGRKLCDETIR